MSLLTIKLNAMRFCYTTQAGFCIIKLLEPFTYCYAFLWPCFRKWVISSWFKLWFTCKSPVTLFNFYLVSIRFHMSIQTSAILSQSPHQKPLIFVWKLSLLFLSDSTLKYADICAGWCDNKNVLILTHHLSVAASRHQ